MTWNAGIHSFGFYVPPYRIKTAEIAAAWGKDARVIEKGLGLQEKAVAGYDEDSLTMGWHSAYTALAAGKTSADEVGAVLFGSETPIYAVNPTSSMLASMLGIHGNYTAHDIEFACKAGTGALISALGFVESGMGKTALVTAADKATGQPGDALEFSAGSGSASFVIGLDNVIARLIASTSFTSDTPDFWRRSGQAHPRHAGRFTGKPGYFKHVITATERVLKQAKLEISDIDQVVFHMPNGKFPVQVAKMLGVDVKAQMAHSFVSPFLGNSYSACSLMGFVAALDVATAGQKILLTSYGSGAGSDAFIFEVTEEIVNHPQHQFVESISNKTYLSYLDYSKNMNILNYD